MAFLLTIMLILYTIACFVLIFVILIQSGKGGGLSSLGSASQGLSEALGATGAEKTLNRLTTWCAAGFVILALMLSIVGKHTFGNRTLIGKGTPAAQQSPQAPVGANPGKNVPAQAPAAPAAPATGATAPAKTVPASPAKPGPVSAVPQAAPAAKGPSAPIPASPAKTN
jgi:preprotein translocase subunit SecG